MLYFKNMKKYFFFLIVCVILCFSFNSTFPLHRDAFIDKICKNNSEHFNFAERSKKMASNLENTLRKIKDTTHDVGKNMYDHFNIGFKNFANKHSINDDVFRQFEKLVIMKKYPYIDVQRLEIKYSPASSKNSKYSTSLYSDRNFQHEPSICEPVDLLNVEVTNRGLSGFAIPSHLSKNLLAENNNLQKDNEKTNWKSKYSANNSLDHNILQSLKEDVKAYIEKHISQTQ